MSFYNREPEVHELILPVRPGVSLLSHRLLLPLLIEDFGIIVGVWKCLLTKRLVLVNDFPSNGCKLDCYCRFWSIIYTNLFLCWYIVFMLLSVAETLCWTKYVHALRRYLLTFCLGFFLQYSSRTSIQTIYSSHKNFRVKNCNTFRFKTILARTISAWKYFSV